MPRTKLFAVFTSLLIAIGPSLPAEEPAVDADWLFAGGTVFDGSGAPGVVGDVAIRGKRIVAVGSFPHGQMGRTIDCRGLVVAPGFIDLHTHSDKGIVAAATRGNVSYLLQGCTTIVTGNCGSGPIHVKTYLDEVDAAGAGTNVLHLLPHGELRSVVLGKTRRAPTPDELARMQKLADTAMDEGAWGMSTGLIYVPGVYAKTDELSVIARVVARHGGFYASHIRNEGSRLLDAVREALAIGRDAGLPIHISHFKASGHEAWGTLRAAAELVEQARTSGQRVTADQYPYIASSTSLSATLIQAWAREGDNAGFLKRLNNPQLLERIRREISERLDGHEPIQIATYKAHPQWVGRTLNAIAAAEGRDQVDLVLEIERHGGASVVNFGMSEEDVRYAMQLPWVATASDGSARLPDLDRPHPRSYGTFARKVGRYSIEDKVLPLPQAIRSCTALPAEILGLADRGTLRAGAIADVVVFDPPTFRDHATFEEPYHYATGVRYVFIAGRPAVYESTATGALLGRALRHGIKENDSTAEPVRDRGWTLLKPFFEPPEDTKPDPAYRSPLVFNDGRPVKTADDWQQRRQEILAYWQEQLGPWPELIAQPQLEILETTQRDGFTQHRIRTPISPDQTGEGYLLVPPGAGPHPAVFVPFYDPDTSVGLKGVLRDFAYQLTKRGFVTLSIGSPGGDAYHPTLGAARCQPLSFLGYIAANAYNALAELPEVDPARVGIVGHSYGGKWSMFGSCLVDKYACAVWSDPGIVFDEQRPSVNYWEPWYLGLDAAEPRPKRGLPTADNPRTGPYKRIVADGHDLHELHALMAPRPFLVSGGSEDSPARWGVLMHAVEVNKLLGHHDRVGMTNRDKHEPTTASNEQIYLFFEHFLKPPAAAP